MKKKISQLEGKCDELEKKEGMMQNGDINMRQLTKQVSEVLNTEEDNEFDYEQIHDGKTIYRYETQK